METFVPQTDTYVRLTESVTLCSTDSVDSEIVSHMWDSVFFLTYNFFPWGKRVPGSERW